ncbi:uncharacterized protein LOC131885538 [Tigriopus californicus]|uniref:uncharacterized protein LOC131885538 n=1 Tax=Tigriopus californicus TaxID=6832 RepID=UPI0027DA2CEC|nr:uncharacterized protein LOC131885538 [Tigriopus californicus]
MEQKRLVILGFFLGIVIIHVIAEQDTKALKLDVTKVTSTSVSLRQTSNSIARSAFNRVDLKMIGLCDGISFNENCPCSHYLYNSLERQRSAWLVKGLRPNFEYNATLTFGNFSTIIASDTFQFQTNLTIGLKLDDIVIKALANRSVEVAVTNLTCARQSGSFDLDFEIEATNIPHKIFTADELASQLRIVFLMEGELLPGTKYKVCTLAQQNYRTKKFCQAITIPDSAPFEPPSIEPYPKWSQNIVGFDIIAPPNYHSMKITSYGIQVFSKCAILDQNCGKTMCEYQHFIDLNLAFTSRKMYVPFNNLPLGPKYLIHVWAQNDLGLGDRPGAFEFQNDLALYRSEANFVLSAGDDYVRVSVHPMCPYLGQDQFHIWIQTQNNRYTWTKVNETDMEYHANLTTNSLSHTFNDLEIGRKYRVCVRAQTDKVKGKLSCKVVALRCTQLDQPTQSLSQVPWSVGKSFNPFTTVRLLIPANTFNGTGTGIKQYVVHCPAQYHWGQARDDDVHWNEDSIVDVDLNTPGCQLSLAVTAIACQNNQTTTSISVQTETIPEFEPNAQLSHDSGVITIELEEDVRVIQYLSNFTTYLVGNLNMPLPKIFDPSQPYPDQNVSRSQFSFPVDLNIQLYQIERRISTFGNVLTHIYNISSQNLENNFDDIQENIFDKSLIGYVALGFLGLLVGTIILKKCTWFSVWSSLPRSSNLDRSVQLLQDPARPVSVEELAQGSYDSKLLEFIFDCIIRRNEEVTASLTHKEADFWESQSPSLNQSKDNLPYDHSRVILKTCVQSCTYINASWIRNMTHQPRYIVAQGPLDHNIEHFWQMVLDHKIKFIIMLAKTKRNDQTGTSFDQYCARYWPSKVRSSVNHGEIKITLEKRESIDDSLGLIKRTLLASSCGNSLKVIQYQLTSWPEHTIPEGTNTLLLMQEILGLFMKTNPHSPVLIHCSNGVGRTGILIAVNELIFEVERGVKQVDIAKYVLQLLGNRPHLIEDAGQYQYIYDCLASFVASSRRENYERYVYNEQDSDDDYVYFT